MSAIIKTLVISALIFCAGCRSAMQPMQNEDGAFRGEYRATAGAPVYVQIITLPDTNASLTTWVSYKIEYELFQFTKRVVQARSIFQASGTVTIEIIDSTNTVVSRAIQSVQMETDEITSRAFRWMVKDGVCSFKLSPGQYDVLIRIEDDDKVTDLPLLKKKVTVSEKEIAVVFAEHPGNDSLMKLINYGGDAQFSSDLFCVLSGNLTHTSPTIRVTLTKILSDDNKDSQLLLDTLVACTVDTHRSITFVPNSSSIGIAPVNAFSSSNMNFFIPARQFPQGKYILSVYSDGDTVSHNFSLRWTDMPISLTRLDIAMSVLRYIATEEEFDTITSGSRKEMIEKFNAFWKNKDRDPSTAYNEVMAEFYSRVDHAMSEFRTLGGKNGALTDRGKIYILYGVPTHIERILGYNGATREVWKYYGAAKTFIFEDENKQGNYTLINVSDS